MAVTEPVPRSALDALAQSVQGDLIEPNDPGSEPARALYNAMIERRPAPIARCVDAADVMTCVSFARAEGMELAVRGGGHNGGGLGAAGRVAPDPTAWSYRNARWAQVIVGVDPDPASAARLRDWTVGYWEALHPYSLGGAYTNFLMDEGEDRVRASYGANYDRLAEIKARYDPTNLFHVNQNIRPAAGAA